MKALELKHTNDPEAALVRELEKLKSRGHDKLAELILRARNAWGKR